MYYDLFPDFSMDAKSLSTTPPATSTTTCSHCTIITTQESRPKYKSYSVKMKLEAVKYGVLNNKSDAARKYNVDPKRIREWTDNKRKLEEMISHEADNPARSNV